MTYKNLSYYKYYRTTLLQSLFPNEADTIGAVTFKEGKLKGVKGKLWHDRVELVFTKDFLEKYPNVIEHFKANLTTIEEYAEVVVDATKIIAEPKGKFNFQDSELGMRQRAAYYVMILQIMLKEITNTI